MMTYLNLNSLIRSIVFFASMVASTYLLAATDFNSELINQSNQHHASGYRLIKTRMWPESGCLLDVGKDILNPGESTKLVIKNIPSCNQGGIGYEIYEANDTAKKHLLGYLSHRFADGKFSVQISRFCEGDRCIFADLNPAQDRKNP